MPSILDPLRDPDWMPSVRAIILLAIVQASRPLDIIELLHECRTHAHNYRPGQCSAAIRSLEADGFIFLREGRYDLTSDPMAI